jgi:hypothetical protein
VTRPSFTPFARRGAQENCSVSRGAQASENINHTGLKDNYSIKGNRSIVLSDYPLFRLISFVSTVNRIDGSRNFP